MGPPCLRPRRPRKLFKNSIHSQEKEAGHEDKIHRAKILTLVALAFIVTVIGVIGLATFLTGNIIRGMATIVDSTQSESLCA